jgi:glycosyltransferase involved in cell wall biosynthesis
MSSNIADSIISQYNIDRGRVKCVYAGSNLPYSHQRKSYDRMPNKNILFVGVDWIRKGGPQLVEAFGRVLKVHPTSTLTIVGCSPDLALRNCHVVGKIPVSEVGQFYERASVFCLPTLLEPFGIAFVEAAHYGLPIIGTNIGAIPDFISNGFNGFTVEPNDIDQIANRLIYLLDNPDKAVEFGKNAHEYITTKYTWPKTVKSIKQHIESCLGLKFASA